MTLCKNCFWKQFWTSRSAQTRKPALSLLCVFWLGHFPRSKIVFESSFYRKSYIITILKKFLERFVLKKGASKNKFPIVFLKCDLAEVGSLFLQKKSEKAKLPKICLSELSSPSRTGDTFLFGCNR